MIKVTKKEIVEKVAYLESINKQETSTVYPIYLNQVCPLPVDSNKKIAIKSTINVLEGTIIHSIAIVEELDLLILGELS